MEVDSEELPELYAWVDTIPLSRPKRNISRDFADGVLIAEVIKAKGPPRIVDLHNYSPANSLQQKKYNWACLNTRVFKRLGFVLAASECNACALAEVGAIERVLKLLRLKMEEKKRLRANRASSSDGGSELGDAFLHKTLRPSLQVQDEVAGISPPSQIPALPSQAKIKPPAAVLSTNGTHAASIPEEPQLSPSSATSERSGDAEALASLCSGRPEAELAELQEMNKVLELRMQTLESLVKAKDAQIMALTDKLRLAGLA